MIREAIGDQFATFIARYSLIGLLLKVLGAAKTHANFTQFYHLFLLPA
jgi:hypothetical protein